MTYKITIEIDATKEQAETLSHIIADWAHGEDPNALSRLPDSLEEMSPAVSLEPHHPDDDDLLEAVQHLRRLGFDTAAAAVQAARRNLTAATATNPWDDALTARIESGIDHTIKTARVVSRLDDLENPVPDWDTKVRKIMDHTVRKSLDDTERRLHARAAVDTHRARGGRVL